MKTYAIEFQPEWCDGCLYFEVDASSEEEAFAIIDKLMKKGMSSCDVTSVDVWQEIDGDDERHLGCYSYPNCDIAPNGCRVARGADVEPYGHRD
tara:strand:- start:1748 stop:2029 length:282 start_codon:yes stop_codon:yes gene_type:complete